jgi:hypothetical protein
VENSEYRRLDNRIFEYNLTTQQTVEINTSKPIGQNDLDPKYAPNDGFVIYTRTSNDGISQKVIQRTERRLDDSVVSQILFTEAFMPNWE